MRTQCKRSCGKCRITAAEIANPSRQNRLTATSAGDRVSQKLHCAGPRLADREDDFRGPGSGATDKLTGGPASCALLGAPAPATAAAKLGARAAMRINRRERTASHDWFATWRAPSNVRAAIFRDA